MLLVSGLRVTLALVPPLGQLVMQLDPMQNCGAVTLVATLNAPGAVNVATIVPLHSSSAAVVPAHAVRKLYDPLVGVAESRRNIVPVSALALFKTASPVCDPVLSVMVTLLKGALDRVPQVIELPNKLAPTCPEPLLQI